jgi:hypothetical protein
VDGWAEAEDYDERIYACQMRHIDQAVRSLSSDHQHAINVEYLNELGTCCLEVGEEDQGRGQDVVRSSRARFGPLASKTRCSAIRC